MTVTQLIKELQQLDGKLRVRLSSDEEGNNIYSDLTLEVDDEELFMFPAGTPESLF